MIVDIPHHYWHGCTSVLTSAMDEPALHTCIQHPLEEGTLNGFGSITYCTWVRIKLITPCFPILPLKSPNDLLEHIFVQDERINRRRWLHDSKIYRVRKQLWGEDLGTVQEMRSRAGPDHFFFFFFFLNATIIFYTTSTTELLSTSEPAN